MKTALVFGVSGQDGAYLARLLLSKKYAVHGTSRDAQQPFTRLHALGIRQQITMHTVPTTDSEAVRRLIAHLQPDEVYNLSGLSSVALSFAEPEVARESIAGAQTLLLETVRSFAPAARVYHSASSECFGGIAPHSAASEETPFAPRSPYAAAKAEAHRITVDYRERHGLFACSGIVFNHESPLRGETFVTKKIVAAAAAIAAGSRTEPLRLGDTTASRDWGFAPEYVEAMWLMLQHREPADFVLATGESHTVEELAAAAFAAFGLDYREHVESDPVLLRKSELSYSRGDASRARQQLGWEAQTKFHGLVRLLADAERSAAISAPFPRATTTPRATSA